MDTYFEDDNFCNVLNIRVDMNQREKSFLTVVVILIGLMALLPIIAIWLTVCN